jgi:hypothetical protein
MVQTQIQTENYKLKGRIVILNSLPLNAFPRRTFQLGILPVTLNELAEWIKRRVAEGYQIVHYVRHPGTLSILKASGIPLDDKPNADLYTYKHGDVLAVVSLKAPPRGQDVAQVSPGDLDIWLVHLS